MKTTVNEDGSITTTNDDEFPTKEVESKVIEPDEKPASKTRSRAEHK